MEVAPPLFTQPLEVFAELTQNYYSDSVLLQSVGGGSTIEHAILSVIETDSRQHSCKDIFVFHDYISFCTISSTPQMPTEVILPDI